MVYFFVSVTLWDYIPSSLSLARYPFNIYFCLANSLCNIWIYPRLSCFKYFTNWFIHKSYNLTIVESFHPNRQKFTWNLKALILWEYQNSKITWTFKCQKPLWYYTSFKCLITDYRTDWQQKKIPLLKALLTFYFITNSILSKVHSGKLLQIFPFLIKTIKF